MTEDLPMATDPDGTGIYTPGAFVWHELLSRDPAKAQHFYTEMFGWTVEQVEMSDMDYYLFYLGDKRIAGMYDINTLAHGEGITPHWQGYVSVPDVDKAAAAAEAAGARHVLGPIDSPNIGRFALVEDPQGAVMLVFKDANGDPDPIDMPMIGNFCWDVLVTTNLEAAAAFYELVIGWEMDVHGAEKGMFKYGELHEAGTKLAPEGVPPNWRAYIGVTDLVAATEKAAALGATIIRANQPTGDWGRLSIIQDPVGAVVALFQASED
ncbi:MAG: VOC family protein [Candidatus Sericytochromatia bacterium]|nr:VOC family protein [Candidatus Sericytochromatia bacterium]